MEENMQVIMYSKDNCIFCDKARNLLKVKSVEFIEYKLEKDFNRDTLLDQFPQARSFPVITVDKSYIGGYNELYDLLETY